EPFTPLACLGLGGGRAARAGARTGSAPRCPRRVYPQRLPDSGRCLSASSMMAGMPKFIRTLRILAASALLVGMVAIVPGSATAQPTHRDRAESGGLDRAALHRGLAAIPAA